MGLQRRSGDLWVTTKEGVSRTIYKTEVFDLDAWHPSIVNEIIDYLKQRTEIKNRGQRYTIHNYVVRFVIM